MVHLVPIACATSAFAVPVQIEGIRLQEVPLRRSEEKAPWCYTAAASCEGNFQSINFLATQVWPSARVAAIVLEKHLDVRWSVCELGCGPGLPSIAAARMGSTVIATDVDSFALRMVELAAKRQELPLTTQIFDLTSDSSLPEADVYVLSDVFESNKIAQMAAMHTGRALDAGKKVWVFAQNDRAQREVYLAHLRRLFPDMSLNWSSPAMGSQNIWLVDIDETHVNYN